MRKGLGLRLEGERALLRGMLSNEKEFERGGSKKAWPNLAKAGENMRRVHIADKLEQRIPDENH